MSVEEVKRLRRQNHAAAERHDRATAELKSELDRYRNATKRARAIVRGSPVDWTDEPAAAEPDGWWAYTSQQNRDILVAAVLDAARPDPGEGAQAGPGEVREADGEPVRQSWPAWAAAMADELARGRAEDPDASGSLAGLTAKVGQLAKTVLSEPPEHVRAEAIRVAAAAIRILEDGDWTLDRVRVRAGLPPLRSLRAGQNT